MVTATLSNHYEIIAIHETSWEYFWLRQVIHHTQSTSELKTFKKDPTIIYEENTTCIVKLQGGFIKGDKPKHISSNFFYTHESQKNSTIDVKQVRSSENLTDLFIMSLPTMTFKKLIQKIGTRRLQDLTSKLL